MLNKIMYKHKSKCMWVSLFHHVLFFFLILNFKFLLKVQTQYFEKAKVDQSMLHAFTYNSYYTVIKITCG